MTVTPITDNSWSPGGGKHVSDLQSDISINAAGIVSGTLKYLDGCTWFSNDPDKQSGNYLALHCEVPDVEGAQIAVTGDPAVSVLELEEFYVSGIEIGDGDTLLSSGDFVIRVPDKNLQMITVVASKEGYETVRETFVLYGLAAEYEASASITWEDTYYITHSTGARAHRDGLSNSGFLEIPPGAESVTIRGSSTINGSGYCFYTTNNYSYPVSGSGGTLNNSEHTMVEVTVEVPEGAVYVAFSTKTEDVEDSGIVISGTLPPANEHSELEE